MYLLEKHAPNKEPWNKGKLMGQKLPLTLQEIWSIRTRTSSLAGSTDRFTCPRGNMRESSNPGSLELVSTLRHMGRTRSGEPRRR